VAVTLESVDAATLNLQCVGSTENLCGIEARLGARMSQLEARLGALENATSASVPVPALTGFCQVVCGRV